MGTETMAPLFPAQGALTLPEATWCHSCTRGRTVSGGGNGPVWSARTALRAQPECLQVW